MKNEKWYVLKRGSINNTKKKNGLAQACVMGNEGIALTKDDCGEILCEGDYKTCETYYSNWVRKHN
ncbi:hypothetical protein SAMN05446037_100291 [Anaerovirgula multivorans]|uniref:Uncharacterized protein n=1 Tax=Anaerovirgula multivorans TaxID=312168 RepID=A0A239AJJ4_9FIRM|nr:hypothetical protein [Anaerovirgula multivorans]SNR95847.1 hypothetical protein SAMN05446037_100291 [Anaerovirgula multivorans]